MLVDSHCHLDRVDLTEFGGRIELALETAHAVGVEEFLCVSVDLESWDSMMRAVAHLSDVLCSVGVHPNENQMMKPCVDDLLQRAEHPKVVAIGETGLDYHYGSGDQRRRQAENFRTHIRAARDCAKPLIVHTRDARADTIDILREEGAEDVGGVLHCFTESYEMAQQAMELGFMISFSGIVTFRNARELQEVARRIPRDRLLVETDAPWLSPVPFRGRPNHPARVRQVAEFVADLRGVSLPELAVLTTDNFHRLFGQAN